MVRERGRDTEQQRGSGGAGPRRQGASGQTRHGPSRRRVLLGGVGLAVLASGCLSLSNGGPGPDKVAANFVGELDSGNFFGADDFIHSESPVSGAGQVASLITSAAGVQEAIDAIDISITSNEVAQKSNGQAVVDTTLEIGLVVRQPTVAVPFDMRKDDGDWRIWNLNL